MTTLNNYARPEWAAPRKETWYEHLLPQRATDAINQSPLVGALSKYLNSPTPDLTLPSQRDSQVPMPRAPSWFDNRPIATEAMDKFNLLATFMGPAARIAPLDALARAKQMQAAGAPREQIWKEHGWFEGPDKKWRFEVDDRPMWMTDKGEATGFIRAERPGLAQRALDWMNNSDPTVTHQSFVKAYPDAAKRLEFKFDPTPSRYEGYYNRDGLSSLGDVFRSTPKGREISITTDNRPMDSRRATALHEMQHYVQEQEGFARGASARSFTQADRDAVFAAATKDETHPLHVAQKYGVLDDDDIGRYLYNRSAGEVEARATEARRNLTPEQRRERPPWMDYDVSENQQIVRFATDGPSASGPQMSANQPQGIPGVRYKDAKLIEILRKYGLLPPVAAGAASLAQQQEPPL